MIGELKYVTFPLTGLIRGFPTFIGTGFFIDGLGGFITAKHVLDQAGIDKGTEFTVIQIMNEEEYLPRKVMAVYRHHDADICIGKLRPVYYKSSNDEIENRKWFYDFNVLPAKDQEIASYAYPNSSLIDIEQNIYRFSLDEFRGSVIEIHERCPTLKMKSSCYQTDMLMRGGSSGGPVVDKDGGVIGINSISYDVDPDSKPLGFITPLKYALDIKVMDRGEQVLFKDLYEDQQNI